MSLAHKLLFAAWLIAIAATGSGLHAQAPDEPALAPGEPTPDVSVPMEKEAQIAPDEMERKAGEVGQKANEDEKRVEQLKTEARKQKDVIKLNCINDKLLQIKQLLNILEDGLSKLTLAIASGDDGERYHRYTVVRISGEKIAGLRDEAEACVGEEISYLGPLSVNVDEPDVPDDPTDDTPWDNNPIDPPGYASPFE
ncbi:MAG TPA: hypothetical protein VK698_19700 [Kofleriaceae bacterium]|nr:hypothetical protein [Kofleriaceae bacterium]